MYSLPQSIIVDDVEYAITNKGDFRMVLDCFNALNDSELTKEERILSSLIIFYEDINSIEDILQLNSTEELVKQMFQFFNCGQPERPSSNHKILIDWAKDAQLVCSAINNVAKKEIRLEPYVHWWTFIGYYNAIGESPLSTIVGIRNKILTGKKLEKHESTFRRENPEYFIWNSRTADDIEESNKLLEIWNSDKK